MSYHHVTRVTSYIPTRHKFTRSSLSNYWPLIGLGCGEHNQMQCYADYAALKHSNRQCYLAEEAQHTSRMEFLQNVILESASGWHQGFGLGSKSAMCGRRCQHARPMLITNAVSFTYRCMCRYVCCGHAQVSR